MTASSIVGWRGTSTSSLVTERDLRDSLLPFGRLREPLSSLSRASAIVLIGDVRCDEIPRRDGQYRVASVA